MAFFINTGRLGHIAETLAACGSWLTGNHDGVRGAATTASSALHGHLDAGLGSALQNLADAWSFDISGIGSDLSNTGKALEALASAYAQVDAEGAAALGG